MSTQHACRILLWCFIIVMAACTPKKDQATDVESDTWPSMDEFHMIMAESFHPFRDSANLAPAKANADSMVAAAGRWLNAPIPSKANTPEIKEKLQQLKHEADAFAILSKTDDTIATGESLTKLHDLFHELQESWYGGHEDHQEHH
jgi:hypothetical protein